MTENIQLSRSIWLHDYLKSSTAERHPEIQVQQYNLTPKLIENALRFATEVDQPIIDLWHQPINKTSTYRCKALNILVGGSSASAHIDFRAGDREPYDNGRECDLAGYKAFCKMILDNNIPVDKIVMEYGQELYGSPSWVHLQVNAVPGIVRGEVYRIGSFTNYKYVPFDLRKWIDQ